MPSPRNLPSTKDLRAFETVAKLGSIKAAADELSLTPSALTRRIQALEDNLGQQLFHRDARGLRLTDVGRMFAARLSSVFSALSEATELARADGARSLRILAPGHYAHGIMRYLKMFERLYPGVQLSLDIYPGAPGSDPRIEDSDVVIMEGDGKWQGWESFHLTPGCYSMPLCAPDYLAKGCVGDPAELAQYTWLQIPYFPEHWASWCNAVGHPGLRPARYFEVNSETMAREAALQGMGIWIGGETPGIYEEEALAEGKLVVAYPFYYLDREWGYYLAYRPASLANPMVAAFKDWLLAGVARLRQLHQEAKSDRMQAA